MEYNAINTLTIQLEDVEIESFLTLLDKLKNDVKRIGFKKSLTDGEKDLVNDMHEKLLGNEENTDKDQ